MSENKPILNIHPFNKDPNHTIIQLSQIYDVTEGIIDNLDEYAIDELLSGNFKDIDNILKLIEEEAQNVLMMNSNTINTNSIQHLPNITKSLDDYLKKKNLSYFITTTLPTFEIEYFHLEWANYVQLYRLLCIIAARGIGKSFFFSWAHILWKMYRYDPPTAIKPNIPLEIKLCKEGMLITNEYKLATRLLKKVKDEIESNDILAKKLLPNGRNDGWGNTLLRTKNGAELAVSSFGSSNRGPHPGWIQLDDFLDRTALYSNEQREKFWESFSAEITNMLLPGGSFTVVGTPFHADDLYAKLKEDRNWKVFEYPAIMPTGETLSRRFPFKDLMNKRHSLGSLLFTREILVRPISDQSSIFPWEFLNKAFVGMQDIRMADNIQSYPIKFKKVVTGCDFAISGSISADYTVYATIGVSSLDEFHLINLFRGQGLSHQQQISELQRINSSFQPNLILAESNGFQKVMIQLAIENGIRNIQEYITTSHNKKDPYDGLPALSAYFERGQIKFPRGDERSKNITNIVAAEFNSITYNDDNGKLESSDKHDDTAMAIHIAIKGQNQINTQMSVSLI